VVLAIGVESVVRNSNIPIYETRRHLILNARQSSESRNPEDSGASLSSCKLAVRT